MNAAPNPYAPPQAELVTAQSNSRLATPLERLRAAIIDGLVAGLLSSVAGKHLLGVPAMWDYFGETAPAEPGPGILLLYSLLDMGIFLACNLALLRRGQTIGKLLVKIQMQHRDTGALLPLPRLFVRRYLPLYAISAAAMMPGLLFLWVIFLVDCLLIFRPGRNTLHDDLAHTKVVKLPD
jgi:uncharacterized RDD family membrane protein YckC